MFNKRKATEEEKKNIRTNVGKLIGANLNSMHIKIKPPLTEKQTDLWQNRIRREPSYCNKKVIHIVREVKSQSDHNKNISKIHLCGINLWILSICK
tara:strand:+ start:1008 stop:1295 length:288 start_codon:yes stop_codon:yes gene_type:complete